MNIFSALFRLLFTGHVRTDFWIEGNDAYYSGKAETANPHWEGTTRHEQWVDGYYGR